MKENKESAEDIDKRFGVTEEDKEHAQKIKDEDELYKKRFATYKKIIMSNRITAAFEIDIEKEMEIIETARKIDAGETIEYNGTWSEETWDRELTYLLRLKKVDVERYRSLLPYFNTFQRYLRKVDEDVRQDDLERKRTPEARQYQKKYHEDPVNRQRRWEYTHTPEVIEKNRERDRLRDKTPKRIEYRKNQSKERYEKIKSDPILWEKEKVRKRLHKREMRKKPEIKEEHRLESTEYRNKKEKSQENQPMTPAAYRKIIIKTALLDKELRLWDMLEAGESDAAIVAYINRHLPQYAKEVQLKGIDTVLESIEAKDKGVASEFNEVAGQPKVMTYKESA